MGNLFCAGDRQPLRVCGDRRLPGAVKLNTLPSTVLWPWGGCLSSYTAQNLGAGKRGTASHGISHRRPLIPYRHRALFVLYFFFSRGMMGLFLNADSGEAIRAGVEFLRIVSPLYFMISIKLMTDGVIRGSGAMVYFVLATIPDLILRIAFAYLLTPRFGSTGIWMAWPFGWFAASGLTILFYRRIVTENLRSDCEAAPEQPDSVNIFVK